MADSKVSALVPASNVLATDAWHIARAGGDLQLTAGVFAANLPMVGNKGTTKNSVVAAFTAPSNIPLTATTIRLASGTYTLPAGSQDQEVRLLFTASATVNIVGQGFTSIAGVIGSTVSLVFDVNKWYILSSHSITST